MLIHAGYARTLRSSYHHLVKEIKLDGCEYMRHFIIMQVKDIAHLQYNNNDGLNITIPTWYQEYMKIFKEYYYHKH